MFFIFHSINPEAFRPSSLLRHLGLRSVVVHKFGLEASEYFVISYSFPSVISSKHITIMKIHLGQETGMNIVSA